MSSCRTSAWQHLFLALKPTLQCVATQYNKCTGQTLHECCCLWRPLQEHAVHLEASSAFNTVVCRLAAVLCNLQACHPAETLVWAVLLQVTATALWLWLLCGCYWRLVQCPTPGLLTAAVRSCLRRLQMALQPSRCVACGCHMWRVRGAVVLRRLCSALFETRNPLQCYREKQHGV